MFIKKTKEVVLDEGLMDTAISRIKTNIKKGGIYTVGATAAMGSLGMLGGLGSSAAAAGATAITGSLLTLVGTVIQGIEGAIGDSHYKKELSTDDNKRQSYRLMQMRNAFEKYVHLFNTHKDAHKIIPPYAVATSINNYKRYFIDLAKGDDNPVLQKNVKQIVDELDRQFKLIQALDSDIHDDEVAINKFRMRSDPTNDIAQSNHITRAGYSDTPNADSQYMNAMFRANNIVKTINAQIDDMNQPKPERRRADCIESIERNINQLMYIKEMMQRNPELFKRYNLAGFFSNVHNIETLVNQNKVPKNNLSEPFTVKFNQQFIKKEATLNESPQCGIVPMDGPINSKKRPKFINKDWPTQDVEEEEVEVTEEGVRDAYGILDPLNPVARGAAGAVLGATVGGITGSLFGPVGAVVGAALGAMQMSQVAYNAAIAVNARKIQAQMKTLEDLKEEASLMKLIAGLDKSIQEFIRLSHNQTDPDFYAVDAQSVSDQLMLMRAFYTALISGEELTSPEAHRNGTVLIGALNDQIGVIRKLNPFVEDREKDFDPYETFFYDGKIKVRKSRTYRDIKEPNLDKSVVRLNNYINTANNSIEELNNYTKPQIARLTRKKPDPRWFRTPEEYNTALASYNADMHEYDIRVRDYILNKRKMFGRIAPELIPVLTIVNSLDGSNLSKDESGQLTKLKVQCKQLEYLLMQGAYDQKIPKIQYIRLLKL